MLKKAKMVVIDGVEYIAASEVKSQAESLDGMDYVIVRADRAGVFAGYLKSKEGTEVKLINSRRLWYWDGASSLSQLAVDGVSRPENCKFPVEVPLVTILGVIEIIPCSENARLSIKGVSVWQQ
jgi:hypothetical protein